MTGYAKTGEGKTVLCTGGAGYIGSHTVLKLLESGYDVEILDNFINANRKVMPRLEKLAGRPVKLHEVDLLDEEKTMAVFAAKKYDAVVHFAGLKAVGESVSKPLWYYHNNIQGTVNLLKAMEAGGCKAIVFSSSATVYKAAEDPISEDFPLGCTNPYGRTKYFIEEILRDVYTADNTWKISLLRYFNPVGAHPSGTIGESPNGIPNNLMPFVQQVAVGRREFLSVFGNDYNTPDGTGVRDYIHVEDLAEGHVAAINKLGATEGGISLVHNLGSGNGNSVLDMVKGFEKACGKPIPYKIVDRRAGDLATVVCKPDKAQKELNWKATRGMDEMCSSAWKWQSTNPEGYGEE